MNEKIKINWLIPSGDKGAYFVFGGETNGKWSAFLTTTKMGLLLNSLLYVLYIAIFPFLYIFGMVQLFFYAIYWASLLQALEFFKPPSFRGCYYFLFKMLFASTKSIFKKSINYETN